MKKRIMLEDLHNNACMTHHNLELGSTYKPLTKSIESFECQNIGLHDFTCASARLVKPI